jgi:hypothetical protein
MLDLWTLTILLWFTSFVAGVFCGIFIALWRKPVRQKNVVPEVYSAMREASVSQKQTAPPSEHELKNEQI